MYPADIYDPRVMQNRPGVEYDETDLLRIFAEDFNNDRDNIVAIQETLGLNPQGTYTTVDDRLDGIEVDIAAAEGDISDLQADVSALESLLFCRKFFIRSTFESIDMWLKSGTVVLEGANCMCIQTAASLNAEAFAEIYETDNHQGQAAYTQNPEFQANLFFQSVSSQQAYIGPVDDGKSGGFGFKVVNNTLYAFYLDNDGAEHTQLLQTISSGTTYILKCKYDNTAHYFYWYVNGTLAHSQAYTLTMATPAYAFFYIKTTTTSLRRMYVADFYYLADLLMI